MSTLTLAERARLLDEAWSNSREAKFLLNFELLSRVPRADLLAEPELAYLLALASYRLGNDVLARELLADIAEICNRRGNDRLYIRRLNLEAGLFLAAGELSAAYERFLRVQTISTAIGFDSGANMATHNLGIVAATRGDLHEALAAFMRALAGTEAAGDNYSAANANLEIGRVYYELGLYSEASKCYEAAASFYRGNDSIRDICIYEYRQARLSLAIGDSRLAERYARAGLRRVCKVGHEALISDGLWTLGMIMLARDARRRARRYLQLGLKFAVGSDLECLAAINEELAVLEYREGNHAAAGTRRGRAAMHYRELGALPRINRMEARLTSEEQAAST